MVIFVRVALVYAACGDRVIISAAARRDSNRALIDDSNLSDIARNNFVLSAVIHNAGLRMIVVGYVPMRPDNIL